ncbi:hypothetical protein [Streptomyces sp. NPDC059411]|uniref:hypothetical protein n=1 Tax=Streptomyces sp. NPDC059411 TaxID=3346825 RepID=UPI0036B17D9E
MLRRSVPEGSSHGRLHLAITGSPSRHAASAASAPLAGITVSGCGTSHRAHSRDSSALSATRAGRLSG